MVYKTMAAPNNETRDVLAGLDRRTQVGEHGYVNLVSVSPQLVPGDDPLGAERMIVAAARVSYYGLHGERRGDRDVDTLVYMFQHGHTSPFEHIVITFAVKAPIFVARQWMRHRTASYNEFSMRYAEAKDEFWTPRELRGQSTDNRQCSDGVLQGARADEIRADMERAMRDAFAVYERAVAGGVSREVARAVLPVATYTQFYVTANLHNMLNFLRLRMAPDAQPEIRAYAEAIAGYVRRLFPVTWAAFEQFTLGAMRLSSAEVAALGNAALISTDAGRHLAGSKRQHAEFEAKLDTIRNKKKK